MLSSQVLNDVNALEHAERSNLSDKLCTHDVNGSKKELSTPHACSKDGVKENLSSTFVSQHGKKGKVQCDHGKASASCSVAEFCEHNKMQPGLSEETIAEHRDRIKATWPSTTSHAREAFPEFCATYECIREHKLPNFIGAKLPVKSGLKIHNWERLLEAYHDKDLVCFLKYGWPVGYNAASPPSSANDNHQSALRHSSLVKSFVQKELQHNAIIGPFTKPPFAPWCRVSPLMTRPKKQSTERRIIMDLSFPHGLSLNDGIDIYDHFGKDISYFLPSVTDLINKLQIQGQASWIWKADL